MTREEINVKTWKFVHWLSFRRKTQFWTHIVKMWNSCPLAWRQKSPLGPKIGGKVQRLITRQDIKVETWKFVHWLSFRLSGLIYENEIHVPLHDVINLPWDQNRGKYSNTMTREEINVETWNRHWLSFRRRTQFWTMLWKCEIHVPLHDVINLTLGPKIGVQRLLTRQEINVETWKFVHWLSYRRRTQFSTHMVKMWNSCPLAWRHKSPLGPKIGEKVQRLLKRQEINVETWKFVHWLSFRRKTQFWTHMGKMWNSCPLAWRHKSPLGPKIGANRCKDLLHAKI